ncbi:MAG TPA: hypothetical protein VI197_13585 [Polyangiaceae bacterium]
MSQSTIPVRSFDPPNRSSLLLLSVLLGALLACGDVKQKLTELVVEKTVEKGVEQAGGGQLDVNLGKVPKDWPAFLAPYPGSKVQVAGTSYITGKLSGSLNLQTSDPPAQVLAHYTKALAGFTLKQDLNMNGALTRSFTKDQQMVTLHVTAANGQTTANVIIANF